MTKRMHIPRRSGLLVAVALLGAVNWQLYRTPIDVKALIPELKDAPSPAQFQQTASAVADTPRINAEVMVERPLFVRTRRPPQPRPQPEPELVEQPPVEAQPAVEPEIPIPEFVLVGVRIDTEGRYGLLRVGDSALAVWRAEGGEIEGWKIERIWDSGASLRQGARAVELKLYRSGEPIPQ